MKALLLLSFLLPSLAAAASPPVDPKFRVTVDPRAYPAEGFRARGFRTDSMLDAGDEAEAPAASPLLTPVIAERDAAFAAVEGLSAYTGRLDELDRDLLFTRARTLEPAALGAYYEGELKPEQLAKLREAVRKVTLVSPAPSL